MRLTATKACTSGNNKIHSDCCKAGYGRMKQEQSTERSELLLVSTRRDELQVEPISTTAKKSTKQMLLQVGKLKKG
jgi:hypothetical protein